MVLSINPVRQLHHFARIEAAFVSQICFASVIRQQYDGRVAKRVCVRRTLKCRIKR